MLCLLKSTSCFNPRPCVRGDPHSLAVIETEQQFQSTPLREGRLSHLGSTRREKSFNPRPCVRGDGPRCTCCPAKTCFNPRPCVRGRSALKLLLRIAFLEMFREVLRNQAADCSIFWFSFGFPCVFRQLWLREPTVADMGARGSRSLKRARVLPGRKRVLLPRAPPVFASWHPGSRIGGCLQPG